MARACPHCGARHEKSELRCSATGLPIAGDPRLVGQTIAGRYHLVRLLGDGGMGAVYKAADQVLRRFVAIKLLHPAVAQNPKSVERFQREARAAAAIGHPNIIDILDFGYTDATPFLVMEYVRGRSLANVIGMDGKLDVERACRIATHTLAGLAAAHDRGILHRDLKPANLMLVAHLGDRDFVKLCDFGFAALLTPQERIDDHKKTLTPARTLVGTPAYAAPERLRGDDRRDPRIDVYSVGVLLFEMLCGMRPFDAPTFAELSRKVKNDPPPSLRTLRPDCPPALERVVHRALAKEPDQRWDNAETFAAALVPFGGRIVALEDDMPSDSFTMDLIRIRARETLLRRSTGSGPRVQHPALGDTTDRSPAVSAAEARRELARLERRAPPELDIPIEIASSEPAAALRDTGSTDTHRRAPPPSELSAAVDDLLRTTDPSPPREDTTILDATRSFSGAFVVPVLRFVARRFGERGLKNLLDALAPEARPIFRNGITADDWVPFGAVNELFERIDATFGRDDLHLVVDCGRAAAEGALDVIRAIQPPDGPPPELLIAEMPSTSRVLLRGIEYRTRRVGRGYARLELVTSGPASLPICVSTLGLLDHVLGTFGAEQAEVSLTSCLALGDEHCLFDLSWLA